MGACDDTESGICPTFETEKIGNFFRCSVPLECRSSDVCNADPLSSPFDESGCLRLRCFDDAGCAEGEACYIAARCFEDQGFPTHIACYNEKKGYETVCSCEMTSDLSTSEGWCVPEDAYPTGCERIGPGENDSE